MIDLKDARLRWHPIAASTDLPPRHVFHGQMLGRELALWRADDGHVNVWENRCLHRGVRLSIGVNDGTELVCQYHGWRYANRTAGCTYIPAHPADAPARTVCNNTYPVIEKYGLVWSGETPANPLVQHEVLGNRHTTALRVVVVNAPVERIVLPLINRYTTAHPDRQSTPFKRYGADTPDPFMLILRSCNDTTITTTPDVNIVFFFQPMDAGRTAIRGLLCGVNEYTTSSATLTGLLKQHNFMLCRLRDSIESETRHLPAPKPWTPVIPNVSETIAFMPARAESSQQATHTVYVSAIESLTPDVKLFTLQRTAADMGLDHSLDHSEHQQNTLPAAQPGAHIDVHLPGDHVRQYSLINGPGQTDHYAIAVKQLDNSTGGSHALHHRIKLNDLLTVSPPRNNFSLRRDALKTHLLAGGIGLTPLLSMARALAHAQLPFALHHFVACESDKLFERELLAMQGNVHWHVGQSIEQAQHKLNDLLSKPEEHHHVYICGPGAMLGYAREVAANHNWPDTHVHFEYFNNSQTVDDSSAFRVELARSGLSIDVPAGQTLLSALREHNVGVASSCEQGACGTCRVNVIEGTPLHQDVYLSDSEKARGHCLMSCVSRAQSERLVLDL